MEIQQQKSSALLASNVSAIVSSQNKIKSAVSKFFTNINHHSYNKQLGVGPIKTYNKEL
jgi:anti-sigma regulatory factor (Ser/Thr protein kinase)